MNIFGTKIHTLIPLIYVLTQIGHFSDGLFATENGSGPMEKLVARKQQFKNWYGKAYMPLKDNSGRLIVLNLDNPDNGQIGVALSEKQKLALHDIINWNIEMFCAKSFDEYFATIKKIANGKLDISPDGYTRMRYWLKRDDAIRRPELLTDYELTESYWRLFSMNGCSNTYFAGLVTSESFYQLAELQNEDEVKTRPDPFPKDRVTCGHIRQITSFQWGNSEPDAEFKNTGKLLVADIRYMFRTNIVDLAYPVSVRVYWSENMGKWVPWFCIEYNAPERAYAVVF